MSGGRGMGPRAKPCYVCGRQTLLGGYDFHVSQCRELFEKRELEKPPIDRRSYPSNLVPSTHFPKVSKSYKLLEQHQGMSFTSNTEAISRSTQQRDLRQKMVPSYPSTINQESKSGSSKTYGATSTNDAYQVQVPLMLTPCPECGRKFNDVAYSKHVRICRKVFQQKRKPFDSHKARVKGTEMAQFSRLVRGSGRDRNFGGNRNIQRENLMKNTMPNKPKSGGMPKWKAESIAFRQAMREAKRASMEIKQSKAMGGARGGGGRSTGYYDPTLRRPPPQPYVDPSYIRCQHCGRSFNQQAAERHIPQCRNIINKPRGLPAPVPFPATTSSMMRPLSGGTTRRTTTSTAMTPLRNDTSTSRSSHMKQNNNTTNTTITTSGFRPIIGGVASTNKPAATRRQSGGVVTTGYTLRHSTLR